MKVNQLDLCHGYEDIAKYLGVTVRRAKYLVAEGHIPTFKMGRIVCARQSAIIAKITELEAKSMGRAR